MATVKLTTYHRDLIMGRLMEHRFSKEERQLVELENKIADLVYNAAFTKKERSLMASLPEGWLNTRRNVYFAIGSGSNTVVMNFLDKGERRFPKDRASNVLIVVEPGSRIAELHEEYAGNDKALMEAKKAARAQAHAVLYSATTLNRLIELWPEVKRFTSGIGPTQLPAIQTDQLNSIFSLTKDKAA